MGKYNLNSADFKGNNVVVGIDLAKFKHMAGALYPDGSFSRPLAFSNNREGFQKLDAFILEARRRYRRPVVVAFEPTSHYGQALIDHLSCMNVTLRLVQPSQTARSKELLDNSPLKNDFKDALQIAWLASQGFGLSVVNKPGPYRKLAFMSSRRNSLVQDRTRVKNRIHRLVDLLFPEFPGLLPSLFGKTGRMLLMSMPTPQEVLSHRPGTLIRHIKRSSRGRLGESFVSKLRQLAAESIGIKEGAEILRYDLADALDDLDRLESRTSRLEAEMLQILEKCPEAPFLLSLPRFGRVTVAMLLSYTGPFSAYKVSALLIKLAGLNLYEVSSGMKRGQRRITRRGNAQFRSLLYFAALRMVGKGGIFRSYYLRLVEKNGVARMKALVAVSRKLLRVSFALVRDKSCFQTDHKPIMSLLAA